MAIAGQVTVRGMEIAYDRAGQGPALVLLHGIGANATAWRTQLDGLSDAFDVIAWDAPGYGRSSDPPSDWPMAEYADHLAGFLDGLGIARTHLLGQSWGGVLAQQFYGAYPDRVRSLILSDTFLGGGANREDADAQLQTRLRVVETMTPAEFGRARAPQVLAPNPSPELLDEVESMLAQIHPAGYRSAAIAIAHVDVRDVLPRIAVPTLVLCGELDRVVPPSVGTRLAGTGHLSNMELPEHYTATVRDFLMSVEATHPLVPHPTGTIIPDRRAERIG